MPETVLTSSFQPTSSRRSPLLWSAKSLSLPPDASGKTTAQMYRPHTASAVKNVASTVRRHSRGSSSTQRSPAVAPIAINIGYAPPK